MKELNAFTKPSQSEGAYYNTFAPDRVIRYNCRYALGGNMLIELPGLPDFGIAYILWVGVLAMGAIAALQLFYFSVLLIPKRGSRPVRQPASPVMPTQPANLDARKNQPLSAGGKMAVLSGLENTD